MSLRGALITTVLFLLDFVHGSNATTTAVPPERSPNPTLRTTAAPVVVEEPFPTWGYGVLGGIGALVLITLIVVAVRWNIDGSNLKNSNPSNSSGHKDLERKLLSRGGARNSLEAPRAKKRNSAKREAVKSSQVLRATSQDVMMGYCETADLKAMEFEQTRGQTAPGANSHLHEWLSGCVIPQPQVDQNSMAVVRTVQLSAAAPAAEPSSIAVASPPVAAQYSIGEKAAALHALQSSQVTTMAAPLALAGLHRPSVFNHRGEEPDLEASKLTNPLSKEEDNSTCLPTGGSRTCTMAVTSGYGTSQYPASGRAERRESRRSMWTAPEGGPLLSHDEEADVVEVTRVVDDGMDPTKDEHDPLDSTLPELILTYGSAPKGDLAAYEISPPAGAAPVDDLLASPGGEAVHVHITSETSPPVITRNPTAPTDDSIHAAGQMIQLPAATGDSLSADLQRERRPSDFL